MEDTTNTDSQAPLDATTRFSAQVETPPPANKALHPRRIFDPLSAVFSMGLIVAVLLAIISSGGKDALQSPLLFNDLRSFFFVVGGTFGCLLFQFDVITLLKTFGLTLQSFVTSPDHRVNRIIDELDEAIITGASIKTLRSGREVNGELLNDIVHMVHGKLFYDEIEALVSSKVASQYLQRKAAVSLLNKGTKIAPALGLLGTVIGLIEVLQSLEDPSKIGPAMSLALMTTAFGSILGSFVFTPLAGRLEHHNMLFLEGHKLLLNRVCVLVQREERMINPAVVNKKLESSDAH